MSQVTYSVSQLLRRPAGQIQSLFSISLTCTLLHTNLPTHTHKIGNTHWYTARKKVCVEHLHVSVYDSLFFSVSEWQF